MKNLSSLLRKTKSNLTIFKWMLFVVGALISLLYFRDGLLVFYGITENSITGLSKAFLLHLYMIYFPSLLLMINVIVINSINRKEGIRKKFVSVVKSTQFWPIVKGRLLQIVLYLWIPFVIMIWVPTLILPLWIYIFVEYSLPTVFVVYIY